MAFNPKADAAALKNALHFFGTDYKTINGIFGQRSKDELLAIANEFAQENPHSLQHTCEGACKLSYGALLVNLLKAPLQLKNELLAHGSHKYVVDVIAPAPNVEILELFQNNPITIAQLLTTAHFSFKKCVEILLKGKRDESSNVDENEALHTAETLYKAGEGKLGTDDDTFINIITTHSPAFLKRVSFHYANTHKHSLDSAIAKETGGDYERLLLGCTKTKYEYFADRFHESLHHIGRDDKFIEFAFSVLTPNELHQVDKAFQERHGKDLGSVIKADTSSHYEELLIMLLDRHKRHNY